MSAPVFRRATRDDLHAILTLLAEDTIPVDREDLSTPLNPAYAAAFDAIDASDTELLAVAELDGAVVGTLQISFLPGLSFRGRWRGQIEAVRVASRLRGRRIGERFLDWALDRCRARGCFMVQLTSHRDRVDAHRFYERLGWERSHAGFKIKLEE